MQRQLLERSLLVYITSEFLGGCAPDLTLQTPLLDLGVLDSFAIVKLLGYAEREAGAVIPLEEVTVETMKDISSIVEFISRKAAR